MGEKWFLLLSKVQYTLTTHFKKELKKEGLDITTGQVAILLVLEQAGQTFMGDLSRILDIDNSAITRLVDKLEKQQMVERRINPEDRRQMLVVITDFGLEKALILKRIAHSANAKVEQGFSKAQMATFKKVAQGIIQKFSE